MLIYARIIFTYNFPPPRGTFRQKKEKVILTCIHIRKYVCVFIFTRNIKRGDARYNMDIENLC